MADESWVPNEGVQKFLGVTIQKTSPKLESRDGTGVGEEARVVHNELPEIGVREITSAAKCPEIGLKGSVDTGAEDTGVGGDNGSDLGVSEAGMVFEEMPD